MIINAIQSCIKLITERNWDKVYWAFDLHGTILVPNYKAGQIPTEFYPHAKETLQLISKMKDVCLIMYTCSHPHEIQQYLEFFEKKQHQIHICKRKSRSHQWHVWLLCPQILLQCSL